MIIYLANETFLKQKYALSYQSLRNDYIRYRLMSDEDFMAHLKEILHFACIVCWLKERSEFALSDAGVIHGIAHLLGEVNCDMSVSALLMEVRDVFNQECCLA